MFGFLPNWLCWTLTALILLRALISGLVVRRGMFAWPMFSEMSLASFRLHDEKGNEYNQWDDLIHADVGMTKAGVDLYLEFLRERHGSRLEGTVTVHDRQGVSTFSIHNTQVDWSTA